MKRITGFTFIELILVVAITGLIISIVLPTLSKFKEEQSLKNTVSAVVAILNQARSDTLSSLSSTNYGVYFDTSKAVYFVGPTYTAGTSTNQVFLFSDVTSVPVSGGLIFNGGGSIVVFNRLTGDTSNYGTIRIQLVSNSSIYKTITVGKTGFVSYQ